MERKDDWKICYGGLRDENDPPDEACVNCEHKEKCKELNKELD